MKLNDVPLVSIIMPAYNAEQFIQEAIESVLKQTHAHWELLIINDGSKDNTEKIVLAYQDARIRYFKQNNKGVSAARNIGLDNMLGEFICFLDADDALTPVSLEYRLTTFKKNTQISFVDGPIHSTNSDINSVQKTWYPSFRGYPHRELVRIKETCFGTVSWMIRRNAITGTRFCEDVSHAEDLLFFIEISQNRQYDFIDAPILHFRRTGASAMANLDGLANGYLEVYKILNEKKLFPAKVDRYIYKIKMIKIMFLSYLASGNWKQAFQFVLKNLFV